MLDIKFIRENADVVKDAIRKKHLTFDLDDMLRIDAERLIVLGEVEALRTKQNSVTKEIAETKDAFRDALIQEMRALKEKLQGKEEELRETMKKWQAAMLQVPNVPDMSVPEGASDAENVELRREGVVPEFSFTPKNHVDLMVQNDMADFERGTKIAGFRGYFLKNDGVLLSMAIWQYALQFQAARGYTPMIAPSLMNREAFFGSGHLPQGEDELYKTQDGQYLSGTAEVPVTAYYGDEFIDESELPKKFVAFSPCFRREAGSHGKDTKGLVRVHEFYKVEQVVLCRASHEESLRLYDEITKNAEDMLAGLGIAYRLVVSCGGDLGLKHVKMIDLEGWLPSESRYRETHSSSYFHDFQARRLNIRYKDLEGKSRFVHTLNNTALATPRLLAVIVENYQNEDGTIRVPEVLQKFIGKTVLGVPKNEAAPRV